MRTETGQVIRLGDYRPSDYLIDKTDLVFRLDPTRTRVTAKLQMRRRAGVAPGTPLTLDGDGLTFVGARIDGADAGDNAVSATADALVVNAPPASETFTLEIETVVDPTANTQLMGLYRTGGNYCTQCEAEGFRRITYFLDRPDVLSVYAVRIEADRKDVPLLLSNGNPVENGDLGDGRHYAVWHDPHPKPSYLFALFAGNLGVVEDEFTTASGRLVTLKIYVEHGKEPRAAYAMDALKRSMRWDEERFGLEYDLDIFQIVAVSDFNMGAMENKGLNIFNDKYVLADPRTATDQDYASIEAIIAHEYFHNWTGNRITCRDWFQLCLKEGLTVYRDQEFSADMRSRPVKRIGDVRLLRAHQFPEDSGPLAHPVRPRTYREINNFYTATVYEKGAEIVRMLRTLLGAKGFAAGMDLYFQRHDGEAATIEQFLACFAEAAQTDLTQFALWYDQPGTPNLAITTRYDRTARTFAVTVNQSLKPPVAGTPNAPMVIPIAFALAGKNGSTLDHDAVSGARTMQHEGEDGVLVITEPKHEIVFTGIAEEPVLSVLRGFSAPVTRVPQAPTRDRFFLARHDSDPFSRWEALNSLAMEDLIKATRAVSAGDPAAASDALVDIFSAVAGDGTFDNAYRALCLTLPAETDIAREIGRDIDPDAINKARRGVTEHLAKACERVFARIYHELQPRNAYDPGAEGAGRRALRNVALTMLCHAARSTDLAEQALAEADNMTDRAHALMVLTHLAPESEAAAQALEAFRTAFRAEPIVLDKWFTIQATVPRAETVETVQALTKAPGFSWDNPNRLRSLIGAFATGNPVAFNRADGKGYELLCAAIRRIDAKNPQVAARLMTAMRAWRNLEPGRRQRAKTAIESLRRGDRVSRDLADIIDRTLA
ncbi:aminopeptidase N [Oceaniradius stylonematis]|uniref:Aminopeptidase N n=1 Tax=Oceaniradius stylonematis TaxID=2184161 RepID=A0A3A8ALE5_9HYPH|nr:aminopeptidase N [Oceaniradius stylonematis]RKF06713.1 aminopeptidase N [Oceaniradius stylonematis]